jgi:hypothetical protein
MARHGRRFKVPSQRNLEEEDAQEEAKTKVKVFLDGEKGRDS